MQDIFDILWKNPFYIAKKIDRNQQIPIINLFYIEFMNPSKFILNSPILRYIVNFYCKLRNLEFIYMFYRVEISVCACVYVGEAGGYGCVWRGGV